MPALITNVPPLEPSSLATRHVPLLEVLAPGYSHQTAVALRTVVPAYNQLYRDCATCAGSAHPTRCKAPKNSLRTLRRRSWLESTPRRHPVFCCLPCCWLQAGSTDSTVRIRVRSGCSGQSLVSGRRHQAHACSRSSNVPARFELCMSATAHLLCVHIWKHCCCMLPSLACCSRAFANQRTTCIQSREHPGLSGLP